MIRNSVRFIGAISLLFAPHLAFSQTPIKEVLADIDPATGKAKDPAKEYSVSGIVAARHVLSGQQVLAFVHNPGEPCLTVLADTKDAPLLAPRNVVKVTGKLGDSPWHAALMTAPGSVTLAETNKPFASLSVGPSAFKDAAAIAGRYVQLTNVTFTSPKFDATGLATVANAGGEKVTLRTGKTLAGRETPKGGTDVFGVVARSADEWQLIPARFLPINRRECQDLATKRTCLACHNPDTQVVGPAYRDVAAKYRNDPNAISTFISQMETGGTGKWGTNVMVPLKALVPPEEMQTLANWVYSYRWDALLAE